MKKFVIISKDTMCTDYLPVYGNTMWNTPNIDELAKKGTLFTNYYTAAPSTVMSFYSMITGEYAHETDYEMYERIYDLYKGETLFSRLKKDGYKCHIVWERSWDILPKYFDCYRDDVEIHYLDDVRQPVGSHYIHDGFLEADKKKKKETFEVFRKKVKEVLEFDENVFLWFHLPHVINGEVSYGSDIELFDEYVGMIRELVPDDCIAITADHGNMNGHKGKICYGFDVYQPAIRLPLIVPRIDDIEVYEKNASSVDLYKILFEKEIPVRKFVYSDTAYRAQKHRKLAIIYNHYKYIYNKKTKTEELYDLEFDPTEEFSLIEDYIYDSDRKVNAPSRELYYYPNWEELPQIRALLREEKNRIWRKGSLKVVLKSDVKDLLRPLYARISKKKLK